MQKLIAQRQNPQQSLEDARIEAEVGGEVGAGYIKDHQIGKFLSEPAGFSQHQRLKTGV